MKPFAVISAALLLLAPAQAGKSDKSAQTPYFPLKVGHTWQYRVGDNKFTQTVIKFEKFGGVDVARLEMSQDRKAIAVEQVGVKDGTVARYSVDGKKCEPPVIFLKFPPQKGMTWKVDSKWDGQSLNGTFRMGEEEVKVPAFPNPVKAVTVTGEGLTINKEVKLGLTCYFVKDVGLVKQVIELGGEKKVTIELDHFDPAKE
jgi:hypothetical protein